MFKVWWSYLRAEKSLFHPLCFWTGLPDSRSELPRVVCLHVSSRHTHTHTHVFMLHHSKHVTLWLDVSPLISVSEANQTTQVCWGHKLPSCTPPDLQPAWLEFTQICPTGKLALIQQRSLHTKEWHTCTTHSGFRQNHYEKTAFIQNMWRKTYFVLFTSNYLFVYSLKSLCTLWSFKILVALTFNRYTENERILKMFTFWIWIQVL